jgi:hypothetical protein
MSHLKLVVTHTPRKRKLLSANARHSVRAQEPLVRRILALPLNERTIGALLTEAVNLSHDEEPESVRRYGAATASLAEVGIHMNSFPPTHGLVLLSWVFVSRYPELRSLKNQIDSVLLTPTAE